MSMGYGAGYADVISGARVSKMCPAEYRAFREAIKSAKTNFESVARLIAEDYELQLDVKDDGLAEKKLKAILNAWKSLQDAFKKATRGLELDIGYHNSDDEGSSYDEVSGAFFCVGGMYQLTPAGRRLKRSVNRKFYVTFG